MIGKSQTLTQDNKLSKSIKKDGLNQLLHNNKLVKDTTVLCLHKFYLGGLGKQDVDLFISTFYGGHIQEFASFGDAEFNLDHLYFTSMFITVVDSIGLIINTEFKLQKQKCLIMIKQMY